MLPTGRVFDTVRVSAAIVHAAAQSGDSGAVGAYLARVLDGPVIHDAYDTSVWYYALVPPGSCAHHRAPDATLLGPDPTWLGVPAVHRTARPGVYWLLPPRHRADHCAPAGVDEVIHHGRHRITEWGPGPGGPDLDTIERGCRDLLDGSADHAHDLAAATESTLRARGYLMLLLPVLEDAEARIPSDAPARSRVLLAVTDAKRQLDLATREANPTRQYAHVRRLVDCCHGCVKLLRELDAQAPAR
ncbi:DUF6415 family natural product biosynthesis protein [Streptomyces sp. NPDC048696]|uniref:DUF6415 family natural product biosynthesis protein n=1 Tax=Streptomyces sp. NPDC048696 TaxID=3365585 RepID=UPI003721924D